MVLRFLKNIVRKVFFKIIPELNPVCRNNLDWNYISNVELNSFISIDARVYGPYKVYNSKIDSYTYINGNAVINYTQIGKFCSIGPNFCCGLGIHPTYGISTSPMFYAKNLSNGVSLSSINKIKENKLTLIGNDVWIGVNVTVIDGVKIGNGAVVAAGAVVTKDIPDYAIYAGVPAKLIRYRLGLDDIEKLLNIKWWDFNLEKLQDVEKYIFDIHSFTSKYSK